MAKRLDQKEYDNIVLLLKAGLSVNKVHQITGRSASTVWYISSSKSFEDYKKISAQRNTHITKSERVEKEVEQPVTREQMYTIDDVVVLLQEQNKLISNFSESFHKLMDTQVVEPTKVNQSFFRR